MMKHLANQMNGNDHINFTAGTFKVWGNSTLLHSLVLPLPERESRCTGTPSRGLWVGMRIPPRQPWSQNPYYLIDVSLFRELVLHLNRVRQSIISWYYNNHPRLLALPWGGLLLGLPPHLLGFISALTIFSTWKTPADMNWGISYDNILTTRVFLLIASG